MKTALRIVKFIWLELLFVIIGHFIFVRFVQTDQLPIKSDGKGYYDFLPAVFIYHDLQFKFREKQIEGAQNNIAHNVKSNGKTVNKYTVGMAMVWLPFFLATHAYMKYFHPELATGFSEPYHESIFLVSLLFLFLGLLVLKKLLALYTDKNSLIIIVQLLFLFGTNLFLYTYSEPSFTHVYSFTFIAAFLYSYIMFIRTNQSVHLYAISFLLAMIVLIRPFNALILALLPFFSGGITPFLQHLNFVFAIRLRLFITLGIFVLLMSVQFIIWQVQSGSFLPWTYTDEKFIFSNPTLWQTLFGFRKGLFIYTPLLFLTLFSFFILFKKGKKQEALWLFLGLFIIHYFMASWQTWWYGASFGLRPYIDFYPVFAVLTILVLNECKKQLNIIILSISSFFIYLNLLQSFQYTNYYLHWDQMNFDYYKKIFLRYDERFSCYLDYQETLRTASNLVPTDSITILDKSLTVNPGDWAGIQSVNYSFKAETGYRFLFVAKMKDIEPQHALLFVDISDTSTVNRHSYHFEQRYLKHFIDGGNGVSTVKYYINFYSPISFFGKLNFGFVKLDHVLSYEKLKLYSLKVIEN